MELDEEDTPPLLVDVDEDGAPEEESNIKVPITIVTGKSCPSIIKCFILTENRIPWSREDYFDELYFE